MSKRSKYTAEEKYQIIKAYEDGVGSTREIISRYKISNFVFYDWRYKYDKYGMDGLRESGSWKEYSQELKENAIKDYLSEEFSPIEISQKYGISSKSTLLNWVKKYNCHRKIKATVKGLGQSMTIGRSTSWTERIEIVQYCIAHSNDYQSAAETYHVSYQQVYQWVKKYESGGEEALKDRRGRKKDEEELTPEDRAKLAMKKLEAENEKLRAENAFLKKLEELERKRP